jgi:hypothetical protein
MAIPVLNITFCYAQVLRTSNGLVQNMHYFYVVNSCFVHDINHVVHCCFFHFVSTHLLGHARGPFK